MFCKYQDKVHSSCNKYLFDYYMYFKSFVKHNKDLVNVT